jgi:hypothetical protein
VSDVAVFQLAQVEAELDTLWRVMFGAEPRPSNPRRALARCWAKAMHVDWGHTPKQPELPLGLVRDDEE